MNYKIANVVAKLRISPLDLDDVFIFFTSEGKKCKYTSSFPAVFVKLNYGTVTMFSTGTVTLNGCTSFFSVNLLYDELKQLGYPVTFTDPIIVNSVWQFHTNNKVSLDQLKAKECSFLYEPELSNSLHIYYDESVRILLHATGNGIITGIRSSGLIDAVIRFLSDIKFLKHTET